jgi:hypothetical protein
VIVRLADLDLGTQGSSGLDDPLCVGDGHR